MRQAAQFCNRLVSVRSGTFVYLFPLQHSGGGTHSKRVQKSSRYTFDNAALRKHLWLFFSMSENGL